MKALFSNVDKLAKKRARGGQINPSMSTKYLKADGKQLSKNAEAWIDKNIDNLKDKELLKELSETSPKTYKEVREYLNAQNILKKDKTFIERIKETPNKEGGFAKNPLFKKDDTLTEKVAEAIDSIDTNPVKVDGKLEFGNTDDVFELDKAKERINNGKPLTVAEAEAYAPILKRNGIDVYAELDNSLKEIDERLKPLVDDDGMVTVYRASKIHPKDTYKKDTFFATKKENAEYYGSSWYKGNPSDLKVKEIKVPANLLKRGGSSDTWQLIEDIPVSSVLKSKKANEK